MGPIFDEKIVDNAESKDEVNESFAWILKLSDEDKAKPAEIDETIMKEREHTLVRAAKNEKVELATNSPELCSSSGYGSVTEEHIDWNGARAHKMIFNGQYSPVGKKASTAATKLNVNAAVFVPSNFGRGRDSQEYSPVFEIQQGATSNNSIASWSNIRRSGMEQFPYDRNNSGSEMKYSLIVPPKTNFAMEEMSLVLAPKSVRNERIPIPQYFQGTAIHSSGSVHPMELQTNLMGEIRCSFYPKNPGRYSVRICRPSFLAESCNPFSAFQKTVRKTELVCPPVEFNVCRNYRQEAEKHSGAYIMLKPNEEKYWGISADKPMDKLYVSDRSFNQVLIVDPEVGKVIRRFGQRNSYGGRMFRPTGLAVDSYNRRLIVADKDNHRISLFTLDGYHISSFGKKGYELGNFNYPWDVDISPDGDQIVVSDSRNHRVQLFDRSGNYQRRFSVFEEDPFDYKKLFDYPRGICFGNDGKSIFSTDFNTNNVLRLDLDSHNDTPWESQLLVPYGKMSRPQGVTMDDMGNLIVCDSRLGCLRIMTPKGDLLTTVSNLGPTNLYVPVNVASCRGGKLAIIDIRGLIYIL